MVSVALQKQHFRLPCQFLFARLSFVSVTPFQRYHKKIFTFNGALIFHSLHLVGATPHRNMEVYNDRAEKMPLFCRFQTNTSLSLERLVDATLDTR
jgi:hypothetical protein